MNLWDRICLRFWALFHPCRVGLNEYDHDPEFVDDSFDHEFGTEVCGHWECANCGQLFPDMEPPGYDYDDWEI